MTTNEKTQTPPTPTAATSPLRRTLKSALIVEDDEALSAALSRFCDERGIKPFVARTQHAAERVLAELVFDVAIVDVKLPDGSGVEVCNRLAELRPRPVIVAVSGAATGREGFMLARAGVGEYVEKPFEEAVALTQNVSQAAKLLGVTRQAVQQALGANGHGAPANGNQASDANANGAHANGSHTNGAHDDDCGESGSNGTGAE